ncbi:glutamyl-Q tRNA(Asp) synthetase [Parasphingorhabdus marina DSM 22363]|uniref:Glutamyl-Q tRNA(Asp) synthetase n=1 Tax=Parasphingorhabdus marina DSM 22363 TaxID=1123272 RepID=A0A1N6CY72_9SPHN|nr:tRNA glutamyl-Q(34) synthetase GluQRS [Parasphingorhabdus marina]SIN63374.1 glutamyl-Q tRNA(Asp) synthetase [Parasphingorhabdus marina DSM 22363]
MKQDMVVRFAPSPNGLLHLGHAYAAVMAHDFARAEGGKILLRIEDIDTQRCQEEYVDAIFADLAWLGLTFDEEPLFQSRRFDCYAAALKRLVAMEMVYPCFCSRSDLRRLEEQGGLESGPDGPLYPGTCRELPVEEVESRRQTEAHSWRLNSGKALRHLGELQWHDRRFGTEQVDAAVLGDVILRPRELLVSYHLAVVLDDAADGISHVVRGEDLRASTHVHRILQGLLDLPVPDYWHHRLLLDETGNKLSKSRKSASLAVLREQGVCGQELVSDLRKKTFPVGITLSKD